MPKNHLKLSIVLFWAFIGLLSFNSCRTVKEVPIQTIEKVVIKDSLIYVHDTINFEIEKVIEKQVLPQLDTSRLSTPLAYSEAYLDTVNCMINHTLEQRGNLEIPVDTVFNIQYVDRIVNKEVPVVTEVVKYRYDALFWVSIGLNILALGLMALRIWLKR